MNFSVAAPNAEKLELLIFANGFDEAPKETIELTNSNKSGFYWHVEVEGLGAGCCYGYKVYGKENPESQLLSTEKVLIDPCARAISGWDVYRREGAIGKAGNINCCLKGVVSERDQFDFLAHPRPRHILSQSIIYELHVSSFTGSKSSNVDPEERGTFLGLIKKIPYLKKLGITTIELLPTFIYDPSDAPKGRNNFWGYSPINWFTPHHKYVVGEDPLQARQQFRKLVAACHDANIEVLVDVVYNHTSEGNKHGPTLSWRGFSDAIYYHKNKNNDYLDVSGCGNSIAANRSLVQQLIIESMRCWALELGVDGFRFDLGIALSRGEGLAPLDNPPLFEAIEADPILSDLKIVSEPWDCGGLYRIGDFPAKRISSWNGCFRDDLRSFWKGDNNTVWKLKERLNGSLDLFRNNEAPINRSINFITSHDGFTLHDLVSFNHKHNLANGESNRDGENHNISWNHGIEGPTSNIAVKNLRARQKRNLLASLLLSPGIPMLSMGDEVGRSQGGNNNSWCQDNLIGQMIWDENHCDIQLHDFIRKLLILRKQLPSIFSPESPREEKGNRKKSNSDLFTIQWHGIELEKPDLSSWSHSLSFSLNNFSGEAVMWTGLNACHKRLLFKLPKSSKEWYQVVNTMNRSPNDIPIKPRPWTKETIELSDRSIVVFLDKEFAKKISFNL